MDRRLPPRQGGPDGLVLTSTILAGPRSVPDMELSKLEIPTLIVHPSVDPLSEKNRDLPRSEIWQILDRLRIPRDKPLVLQVGPYARSKDPAAVVHAYRRARKMQPDDWATATPEALHELRQAVVIHRYQMELVEELWPRLGETWIEEAQRQLERTDRDLKQIALDCGFGSADVMRRPFARLGGVTPDRYRRSLGAAKADLKALQHFH